MPKPSPIPDEVSKPFWDACNERRLIMQTCAQCDKRAIAKSGLGTRPRSPVRLPPAIPTGWSTARIRIEIEARCAQRARRAAPRA
jgi:hypothetical protein